MLQEVALSPLGAWESFYVIVGSSAAALTGLQFVVIVLGAEMNAIGGGQAVRAFATPTIVHFGAVLLISAILSAPWHSLSNAGLVLAACGLGGTAYVINIVRHARRQKDYKPVLEDWLWHFSFPLLAYATLLVAALLLRSHPVAALFWVGTITVFLLFIGIHNAWDAVTWMAQRPQQRSDEAPTPS
jgi:hypothetical protein